MSRWHIFVGSFTLLCLGQGFALEAPSNPWLQSFRGVNTKFGGGNFYTHTRGAQFEVLQSLSAGMCRISFDNFYKNGKATPEVLDDLVWEAYQHGVVPMILFEHYVQVHGDFGGRQKWFDIGQAFATRFRPNGEFWKAKGVSGIGITLYSAINEPELQPGLNKAHYVEALDGLGDGVHSVDKTLQVHPGGFMSANAFKDWSLRGFAPLLAPLWNAGKLDGIDLHTYYDVDYAPMRAQYGSSAQANFDSIKIQNHITADVNFYATEFNFKKRQINEEQAAKGLLTGMWDELGVVKNDGHTPATGFAFVWNLFNGTGDAEYGLDMHPGSFNTARAKVVKQVLDLSRDMVWHSLDPKASGEFILGGKGRKLWVWQNMNAWTNHPGTEYTLQGIPKGATKIEVYSWNGIRQTLIPAGATTLTVKNLTAEETYMFLASGFTEDLTVPIQMAPTLRVARSKRGLNLFSSPLFTPEGASAPVNALGRSAVKFIPLNFQATLGNK